HAAPSVHRGAARLEGPAPLGPVLDASSRSSVDPSQRSRERGSTCCCWQELNTESRSNGGNGARSIREWGRFRRPTPPNWMVSSVSVRSGRAAGPCRYKYSVRSVGPFLGPRFLRPTKK